MRSSKSTDDRGQFARLLFTVALAAVAVRSLLKGERLKAGLASIGALALGYNTVTQLQTLEADFDIEPASEDGELHCSVCGEPIEPGQRRKPDTNGETVHEACLEAPA